MALQLKNKPRPSSGQVTLPSAGYPYGGKIPDGRLEIRAFSFETERLLFGGFEKNTGETRQYLRTLSAIKQVAKLPEGFAPDQLLPGDVFYILLASRALSYGSNLDFKSTCPHCDAVEDTKIQVPEGMPTNRYEGNFQGRLKLDTSEGNSIEVRFLSFKEEMDIDAVVRNKLRVKAITEEAFDSEVQITLLCKQVASVNGNDVTSQSEVRDWLTQSVVERQEIQQFIQEVAPGVSFKIPMSCPTCSRDYDTFLSMEDTFFRVKRRADARIVPPGVRLGVIGKNERSEVAVGSGQGSVPSDSPAGGGGTKQGA